MEYDEILGSDKFVQRLVEIAVNLDKIDDNFLIIPPGGVIRQDQFIR
jgi:hypothetical protein